jgi:chemotaxis signal transduction protein
MTQIAHTRSAGGAANALARQTAAALQAQQAAADAPQQYLTFLLGGEMFAVGILNVKEIIEYGNLTEIPMMPPFIRGVINLRGSVVPVIDLSARFGHAQSEVGKRTCIVIVEVSEDDCATTSGSWSMRSRRCSRSPAARSSRHPPSAPASAPTSSSAWARWRQVRHHPQHLQGACRSTRSRN